MSTQGVSEGLTEGLSGLARLIISEESIESTAVRVVQLAIALIEPVDLGSVALMVGSQPVTLGPSDDVVSDLDRLQWELNEGPCYASLLEQKTVQVDDFATETRWPRFSPRMTELGIVGLIAFALKLDGQTGSLNLYTRHDGGFDRHAGAEGVIFAAQAVVALRNAKTHAGDVKRLQDLEKGMVTRDVIGTAIGILMERESCTREEALDLLKRASQNLNMKLRDIAGEIIDPGSPHPGVRGTE